MVHLEYQRLLDENRSSPKPSGRGASEERPPRSVSASRFPPSSHKIGAIKGHDPLVPSSTVIGEGDPRGASRYRRLHCLRARDHVRAHDREADPSKVQAVLRSTSRQSPGSGYVGGCLSLLGFLELNYQFRAAFQKDSGTYPLACEFLSACS